MLPIGTRLCTRDGRRYGNAIIVEHRGGEYLIETDYGNVIHTSDLSPWRYDLEEERNLERWYEDRRRLREF